MLSHKHWDAAVPEFPKLKMGGLGSITRSDNNFLRPLENIHIRDMNNKVHPSITEFIERIVAPLLAKRVLQDLSCAPKEKATCLSGAEREEECKESCQCGDI